MITKKHSTLSFFNLQWRRWLDDCLVEFNNEFRNAPFVNGGVNRLYHQENVEMGYHPGELVEFGEDGSAYPHAIGGTNWIPKAVTPWKDSPYFVD